MADCGHLTPALSPARGIFGEVDMPTTLNEVSPAQLEMLRASRIRAALQGGRAHQHLKPATRLHTAAPRSALAASLLSESSLASGNISLAATLADHLDQMRKEHRLIDVVLVVQGHCFPCHRIVLAAWSGYFSHMFSGGWCEASKTEVVLDSIRVELFEEMLDFFYTGRIQVTAANATRLLQLASFLEIHELEQSMRWPPSTSEANAPHLLDGGCPTSCPRPRLAHQSGLYRGCSSTVDVGLSMIGVRKVGGTDHHLECNPFSTVKCMRPGMETCKLLSAWAE
eukprot:6213656-Pleurochrysis_carterae.AAC.1